MYTIYFNSNAVYSRGLLIFQIIHNVLVTSIPFVAFKFSVTFDVLFIFNFTIVF